MRGCGGRSGGRDGRSSIQCEVCFKYNHTALTCYNHFNPQYQASNNGNNGNGLKTRIKIGTTPLNSNWHSQHQNQNWNNSSGSNWNS